MSDSEILHRAPVSLKYRTQKLLKKSPPAHHHTTLSGYVFATKACIDSLKNLLNSNISSTCPHNMVNFSPLAPEIVSLVWGTPANFNGFRVLASLLQRRRSTETNQTLHDVWPSPGLVHYTYIFGGSCPRAAITLGIGPHSSFVLNFGQRGHKHFPRGRAPCPLWLQPCV